MNSQSSGDAAVPGARTPHLEDDFGFAIGVVFRDYAKALEDAIGDIPGGPRGYFVLAAAVRGQASSQRFLAERHGVDRTVMTYLLDDLEQAGLVERRPDPVDRRSRRIVATEHGKERWEEMRGPVGMAERRILDVLPEGARAAFRAMLCTLASHVTADGPTADACKVTNFSGPEKRVRSPRRGQRRSTA